MMLLIPLIRKLEYGADLTEGDHERLSALVTTRPIGPREDIAAHGDRPDAVHIVLSGFACRYKVLRDGKRQIVALTVPGDFCDLHAAVLGAMDHGIATLSPCIIADLPRASILEMTERYPHIGRALWWATLVDDSISREWLVNIGQREASQRLAHLFCELLVRQQSVGVGDANGYAFPLTQADLAAVLGLTSVHINRTLQALRDAGLIALRKRRLDIPDVEKLKIYCNFNQNYLYRAKKAAAPVING